MWGSQALETAIGLALLFFVMAAASSATVEVVSRLTKRRADDLERGLAALLAGTSHKETDGLTAVASFQGTAIYKAALAASEAGRVGLRQVKPSYLSARSFADGVVEMLYDKDGAVEALPANLKKRLRPLLSEARGSLTEVKAGLERWFDEGMAQVEAAYKRWATTLLFCIGLAVAVAGNVSTIDVAQQLWQDPVTRQTVVDSAAEVIKNNREGDLADVSSSVDGLKELGLPIGYHRCEPSAMECDEFQWTDPNWGIWSQAFAGWIITAFMVMLGAPFWFDLLSRLVSLRTSGSKPPTAAKDEASATSRLLAGDAPSDGLSADQVRELVGKALPEQLRATLRLA